MAKSDLKINSTLFEDFSSPISNAENKNKYVYVDENNKVNYRDIQEVVTDIKSSGSLASLSNPTISDWVSERKYEKNDVVIYNDNIYQCNVDQTNKTEFDVREWKLLAGYSKKSQFFYNPTQSIKSIELEKEVANKDAITVNINNLLIQSNNYVLEEDNKTVTFYEPIEAGSNIEIITVSNAVIPTDVNNVAYLKLPITEDNTTTLNIGEKIVRQELMTVNVNGRVLQFDEYELSDDHMSVKLDKPVNLSDNVEVSYFTDIKLEASTTFHPIQTKEGAKVTLSWDNPDGLANPDPVDIYDGATFVPHTSKTGIFTTISWTNDNNLENPQDVVVSDGATFIPHTSKEGIFTTISWTNDGSLDNPENVVLNDGVTFTPIVNNNVLSFTNNGNLENPDSIDFNVLQSEAKSYADAAKLSEVNAKNSEENAKVSETNAKTSETNAKLSEENAKTSEESASASATTATEQAEIATAKALEASESANNAKTSETNAKLSETNAKNSETNAKTSEENANTSEINAKTSEESASASATTATEQAEIATTKANEASTSALNASVSETNAKTSETNAKALEEASKTSEENASVSASNAKTSETKSEEYMNLAKDWAIKETGEIADGGYSAKYYANQAKSSADNAKESEVNAKASADTSSAKAITATEQATIAVTKAEEATEQANIAIAQATIATEQANIATTKASEASTSATNSETSASNAKTSEDNAKLSETNAKNSENLAKDWATKLGDTVDGTEYSSKYYAESVKDSISQVQALTTTATEQAEIATAKALEASESADRAANSQVNADWNATEGKAQILNKPDVYTKDEVDAEILDKGNVQSDWDATEGKAVILNKPKIPSRVSELSNDSKFVTEDQLNNAVSSVYKVKGSVDTVDALPVTKNVIGDVWNVLDTGANYVWNGVEWDKLSEIVDLSDYYKKEDVYTKTEVDDAIAEKGNVQSDWDATEGKAVVLNKPKIKYWE